MKLFSTKTPAPVEALKKVHATNEADRAELKKILSHCADGDRRLKEAIAELRSNPSEQTARDFVEAQLDLESGPLWRQAADTARPAIDQRRVERSIEPARVAIRHISDELTARIGELEKAEAELRRDLAMRFAPAGRSSKSEFSPPPAPEESPGAIELRRRHNEAGRILARLTDEWAQSSPARQAEAIDSAIKFALE